MRFLLIIITLLTFKLLSAQKIPAVEKKQLIKRQDSLKTLSDSMINAYSPERRFRSDSHFVRILVRALKTTNSFYFPFDSLRSISRLYAPDSTFRIFTWQLKKDEYMYHQKGAIQIRTVDGSLKLLPLFDASMFSAKLQDSVRNRNNWVGAIYYRIILKEHNGKKYYTLLGFDDFSINSNRKWMEVLTFDANGEPLFGGPYISFKEDTVKRPVQSRFNIEYKKEAMTLFNYNPELDLIIYDHLISETEEPQKKSTYIPDGDYEGFKWQDGQWVHVDKVFNFKLKEGEFPTDDKLRDDAGNIDEKKLEEASQRNIDKKNPPPKTPQKKKTGDRR